MIPAPLSALRRGFFLAFCGAIGLLFAPPLPAAQGPGHAALAAQVPAGAALNTLSEPVFLDVVKRAAAAQPDMAPQIAAAAARISVGKPTPVEPTAEGLASIAIAALNGATPEGETPDGALVDAVIQAIADAVTAVAPVTGVSDGKETADPKGTPGHKEMVDFKGGTNLPTAEVIAAMTEIVLDQFPLVVTRTGLRNIPPYNYTTPPNTRPAPTPTPTQEEEEKPKPAPRPRPTPVIPPKQEVTPFRPSAR